MQEPVIIKDFLSEDLRKYLSLVSKIYLRSNNIEFDIQDGANSCAHHDSWTDALAITSLKKLREITKKNLEPTYAYLRIYKRFGKNDSK